MHFKPAAGLAMSLVFCSFIASAQSPQTIRFAEMDTNHDGVITRDEWRGSDQSFRVHDWNHDGVLSGDEVRIGAWRRDAPEDEADFDSPNREYEFDDWTERGFRALDHNRDGRITRDEWHFDREGFRRADHNNDGVISHAEFLGEDQQDDDRGDRFAYLDVNRDGRVSRDEWHGGRARFDSLDTNRDGVLTRDELAGSEPPADLFSSVDVDHDGVITRGEWHWSRQSFDSRDANRDGRLTREEFTGATASSTRSPAYRAGYERGRVEGLEAGREDRETKHGWDLEGQRELESADSGYDARVGSRADYQAGYREGFRAAYREGFEKGR
jgi:Ca2+-binding EF-hand superfamily protein